MCKKVGHRSHANSSLIWWHKEQKELSPPSVSSVTKTHHNHTVKQKTIPNTHARGYSPPPKPEKCILLLVDRPRERTQRSKILSCYITLYITKVNRQKAHKINRVGQTSNIYNLSQDHIKSILQNLSRSLPDKSQITFANKITVA